MAGLRLSESTVERTAEAAGQRVRERLREGNAMGPASDWTWQRDACGRRCAYISLDATGVRRQGPGGHHAEGGWLTWAWSTIRAANMIQNVRPRAGTLFIGLFRVRRPWPPTAPRGVGGRLGHGRSAHCLVGRRRGLEQFFKRFFPKAVCISTSTMQGISRELAQSLYGEDESARQAWLDDVCHRLNTRAAPQCVGG